VYGAAGLLLYFFRNLSPVKLAASGFFLLACLTLLHSVNHIEAKELRQNVSAIEALSGEAAKTEAQLGVMAQWETFFSHRFVSPKQIAGELVQRKSGYWVNVVSQAPITILLQTRGLVFGSLWDALAMMLLGMAMMKWQIFNAQRSTRFYSVLCAGGFAVGLGVNAYEIFQLKACGFEMYWSGSFRPTYEIGRLFMALGYIGAITLSCKHQVLCSAQKALAWVGKMALANYPSHSIICNSIFMGFGLGLAGELERYEVSPVVVGIWTFQLVLSSWWLQKFKFGPAEWLWRTLTYGERQPLKN
jgi:uncharacterized protein